jgi:hypothetical protein
MMADDELRWTITNVWRLPALEQLALANETWSHYHIVDYRLEGTRSNSSSSSSTRSHNIGNGKYYVHVEKDFVISTSVDGRTGIIDLLMLTIPELFANLANRMLDGEQGLIITYHELYGYPTKGMVSGTSNDDNYPFPTIGECYGSLETTCRDCIFNDVTNCSVWRGEIKSAQFDSSGPK